jgi:dipeptidase E
MSQLFLTSSIHKVAKDIVSKLDLSKGNKLVFITTPVEAEEEQEDLSWLYNDRQALVDAWFDMTDYTITGKQRDQLMSDLQNYDYIYMSGGNTYYFIQQSQKTDLLM